MRDSILLSAVVLSPSVIAAVHSPGAVAVHSPGAVAVHSPGAVAVHSPGAVAVHSPGAVAVQSPGAVAVHSPGAVAVHSPGAVMDDARSAWQRGHHPTALESMLAILRGPFAADYYDEIALLTGELHPVREVAADGRRIRLSGDGKFAAYQTPRPRGSGQPSRLRVVALEHPVRTIIEVEATTIALAPRGELAAVVFSDPDHVRLIDLSTGASDRPPVAGARIVWRPEGVRLASAVWGPGGDELLVIGADAESADRTNVYSLPVAGIDDVGDPTRLTDSAGFKVDPIATADGCCVSSILHYWSSRPE